MFLHNNILFLKEKKKKTTRIELIGKEKPNENSNKKK